MRWSVLVGVLGLGLVGCADSGSEMTTDRINQMIPLIEQGLPVLGVAHPPYVARRSFGGPGGGGAATPAADPPEVNLAEAAAELVAYQLGDYELNSYSPNTADQYRAYMEAIIAAGGSARTNPFMAKIPIMHTDPTGAAQRLIEQLNDGQVSVAMQQVETVEEVNQAISAMRFTSKGGTRPESGFELAAAYWGLTAEEYLEKADVWPINPNGELVINVIIESREGVANARAIAAMEGVAVVTVGAGTLGGVFTSTNDDGERVRDQEGFDAAVASVLAACKEFNKACGYPANNPAEVESLMEAGWNYLIMQRRNQDAFDAVLTARRLSGRSVEGQ